MTLYRLVPEGFDDHQRPQEYGWDRYHFQPTQWALLLFTDGTVVPTQTLYRAEYLTCDDVAGGGIDSIYADDSWQFQVLTDAGYQLELVS